MNNGVNSGMTFPAVTAGKFTEFRLTGTFRKDPRTKWIIVEIQAGGAGGMYGTTTPTSNGPYGGGAGAFACVFAVAFAVPDTVLVILGSGGAGGSPVGVGGTPPVVGGGSSFGSYITVSGGNFSTDSLTSPANTAVPTPQSPFQVLFVAAGSGYNTADSTDGTPTSGGRGGALTGGATAQASRAVYRGTQLVSLGAVAGINSTTAGVATTGNSGNPGFPPYQNSNEIRACITLGRHTLLGGGASGGSAAGANPNNTQGSAGGDGVDGSGGGAGAPFSDSNKVGPGGRGGDGYCRIYEIF